MSGEHKTHALITWPRQKTKNKLSIKPIDQKHAIY